MKLKIMNNTEEPKKPNLTADIVSSFLISLLLTYILFGVSMGQWNTYYWEGFTQFSFGLVVAIITYLLAVIKYNEL